MNSKKLTPRDLESYLLAEKTVYTFIEYLENLQKFKDHVGLKDVENMFEVATSIADKSGRICRQIKHIERKDPKENYKDEIIESIQGFLAYSQMVIRKYGISNGYILVSVLSELQKSIKQHARKKK